MLQSLTEKRIVIIGVVVTTLVVIITTGAIRSYTIYRLATDQAVLQSRFQTLLLDEKSKDDALRKELDALELTLYTNGSPPIGAVTTNIVSPTPTSRRESSLEQIVAGQVKDLRDRVTALEQWRLKIDHDNR